MTSKKAAKPPKVHCAECKKATNHIVIAAKTLSGFIDGPDIHWSEEYQIVQCKGCDTISFRKTHSNSEHFDPYTGDCQEFEELYPNPANSRAPMEEHDLLPAKTGRVYREVLKAISHGAPILAAIGLRAVIKSVCVDQGVSGRTLKDRIDQLADKGLLSKAQADILHAHRFMGNLAAHEISSPKPSNLIAALDIAETLLKTIYILPYLAEAMKQKK